MKDEKVKQDEKLRTSEQEKIKLEREITTLLEREKQILKQHDKDLEHAEMINKRVSEKLKNTEAELQQHMEHFKGEVSTSSIQNNLRESTLALEDIQ